MSYRYYPCRFSNVQPRPRAKQAVERVNSKKNKRLLTSQYKYRTRIDGARKASKFRRVQKRDAKGQNVTLNRDTNAARNIKAKQPLKL